MSRARKSPPFLRALLAGLTLVGTVALGSCERSPAEPPVEQLGGDSVRTNGNVVLPAGTTVTAPALTVTGSGGRGALQADGSFTVIRLKTGRPGVLFAGRTDEEVLLMGLVVDPTAPARIDSAETAAAMIAMHHALAGADSTELLAFVAAARGHARFATLSQQVAANLRAGTDLYAADAPWALADSIVAATFGAAPGVRAADAVDANDPTFQRLAPGSWRVGNLRPIYLGVELHTASGAVQEVVLRPATYEWQWSLAFYHRVASATPATLIATGSLDGGVTRGIDGNAAWLFQTKIVLRNGALIAWTGVSTFISGDLLSKDCVIQAAIDAPVALGNVIAARLQRLDVDAEELVGIGNDLFEIVTSCADESVRGQIDRRWMLAGLRTLSKYLSVVDRATSAWQFGQMLAAMGDPLDADRFALLDHGDAVGMTTTNGGVWATSSPSGATVTIDGAGVGTTPVGRLDVSPGEHVVRFTMPGRVPTERAVVVARGRWSRVHVDLSEADLKLRLTVEPVSPQIVVPGGTASFRFRVSDVEGNPVIGAQILATAAVFGTPSNLPTTGADGTATWSPTVRPDAEDGSQSMSFRASKSGHVTSDAVPTSVTVARQALRIEVEPSDDVEVYPANSVTFTITVRDASDAAVPGAIVTGADGAGGGAFTTNATDGNGRTTYRSEVPASRAPGTYPVTFSASRSGHAPSPTETVSITVLQPQLSLAVEPSGDITRAPGGQVVFTATVRNLAGSPVEGARVEVSDELEGVNGAMPLTDSNGRATWTSDIPASRQAGDYDVDFIASKAGFDPSSTIRRRINVVQQRLVLTVTPTSRQTRNPGDGYAYTITATDQDGSPVPNASVVVGDPIRGGSFPIGETNAQGRIVYDRTVPSGTSPALYTFFFGAVRAGYTQSEILQREIQVVAPGGILGVTLQTHTGGSATASGTQVLLYAGSTVREMTGSNPAVFQNVPAGNHLIEGYFHGTFLGREFWANARADAVANQSRAATLRRVFPYAESVVLRNNATNAVIAQGATIAAGVQVRVEIVVRNATAVSQSVRIRGILDRSQGGSYDLDGYSSSASVGANSTRTFSVVLTPSTAGTYHRGIGVYTVVTGEVLTDSWNWQPGFVR